MVEAAASKATISRIAVRGGIATPGMRALPEEVPVALSFGGTTQAVMMATPNDLEDFGIGFALSEAIAHRPTDVMSLDIVEAEQGFDVQIQLDPALQTRFSARRRKMAGPVGCGLCGIESIEEALRALPQRRDVALTLAPDEVHDAVQSLTLHQVLRAETGAVHAAGFYRPGRGMALVREDVGRHNALDKLIGAMARARLDAAEGVVVLTSRISVDMVQKAAIAGAGVLVSVSAPTALAVRTAEQAGLTLIGIARGADFDIFTRPDRIIEGQKHDVA
ncbi:formate dehydrogenase accessory sulfurtransferase FdhD [Hoeflea olei]|uniref:Sulfur carrier protein FdhD n=1 Tax=Hoeflea olei TaxID=1480615 RepID=A0A1C1YXN5_9HYPH|nr:formate dehydrogenase accessory sulfurtransferase FdhD [Hoeflea olei]OCW58170.1 sufurtransferase FdhD [Hoeflea olei]